MVHFEHARQMLACARADLDAAMLLARHSEISDRIVGFHLQQAVEKGLKSALIATNTCYPLTHNLTALFDLLHSNAPQFRMFEELCELSDFAVTVRYSFEQDWWEQDEEQKLMGLAVRFLAAVEQYLTNESQNASS